MIFTLRENAIDSLNRSFRYFLEDTTSGLKAAVKEIISSIELFLKEKIRTLDLNPNYPVLVYDKLKIKVDHENNKYILEPFSNKTTITLHQAFERLLWLGAPISETDKNVIFSLKKIRNSLEHFSVDIPKIQVRSSYISTIGFVMHFLDKYLNIDFFSIIDEEIWRQLVAKNDDIKALRKATAKEIYDNIIKAEIEALGLTNCIKCNCDLFIEKSGGYYSGFKCVVCGYNHLVEICYGCNNSFFIEELEPGEGDTMWCTSCLAQQDLREKML